MSGNYADTKNEIICLLHGECLTTSRVNRKAIATRRRDPQLPTLTLMARLNDNKGER